MLGQKRNKKIGGRSCFITSGTFGYTLLYSGQCPGLLGDHQPGGRRGRVQAGGHQPCHPWTGGNQLEMDQVVGGDLLGQEHQEESVLRMSFHQQSTKT